MKDNDSIQNHFFLVACDEKMTGVPFDILKDPVKAVHYYLSEAEYEAINLAKKSGKKYIVLQSIGAVQFKDGQPIWSRLPNIK